MSRQSSRPTCLGLIAFFLALAGSSAAFANGSAFFKPAGANEKVDLAYFGKIKGPRGQNLDFVECEISDGVFEVRWENDRPGHYRSPDVGKFIKGYGQPLEPRNLLITCFADGYDVVSERVPNKSQGIHQVDFVLPAVPRKGPPLTDMVANKQPTSVETSAPSGLMGVVPGLLALVAIGAAVRKSGHPRSTDG